ncbi:tetratricopeptide repeat protein [uncultured Gimesia sp.]|uniref:tetratricopeptide repeat protein n=1 Tax=uncultured Gimesia sp. TaxID=1678688 RepID=UPI0030DD5535|tara:strand:- start:191487 stop:193247 length:1761 start_codon:yes stop_codon:yes gene_type:complete
MVEIQEQLKTALSHHQSGDLDQAETIYQRVLESNGRNWEALYYLGTLQLQRGDLDQSITNFLKVTQLQPELPDVHNNLGVAYHAAGKWQESGQSYEQALRINPHYERAYFNLGSLTESRGLFTDAAECYRKSYELNKENLETYQKLADVLKLAGDLPEAEKIYRELLGKVPDDFNLSMKLAYVLVLQRQYHDAIQLYESMLETHPEHYQILVSLSYAYESMGNGEAAIQSAKRAIQAAPVEPEGYNNLGNALKLKHDIAGACDNFMKALSLRPDFPMAEFNLATTNMLAGDLAAGWRGYERRVDIGPATRTAYSGPRWQGESLAGKTILLWCEQGFGDTLLFLRFAIELKRQGAAQVLLLCQTELADLLQSIPEIDQILIEGDPIPEYDYQSALLSVPLYLETSLETIPVDVPFLVPSVERQQHWLDFLSEYEGKKIGLNWSGNLNFPKDKFRSIPLQDFLPFGDVPGVQLVSLQQVNGLDQIAALTASWNLLQPGAEYKAETGDFTEVAALIQNLDLVITCDTAVAHLAGCLGVPVWILVSELPEWRWLLDRTDSPWYPSARLFRQKNLGDWEPVIAEVKSALEQ